MLRNKLWIVAVVAVVVAVSLAPAAFAGGWSTVALDAPPKDVVAGQEFTVGFTVLQHGVSPLSDLQPLVKLKKAGGGESQTVRAAAEGRAGHYMARIVLEQPGSWEWAVEAFEGDHVMAPLTVNPAPIAEQGSSVPISEPVTAAEPVAIAGPPAEGAPNASAGVVTTSNAISPWLPAGIAGFTILAALTIVLASSSRRRDHFRRAG